jgi:hypothetical protein
MHDVAPDGADDTVLMTFRELATARGISRASAGRLVTRHGWRRVRGNDRLMRVHVPAEWAARRPTRQDDSPPHAEPTDDAVRVLEAALALASGQLALGRDQLALAQAQHDVLAGHLTRTEAGRDRLALALAQAMRQAEAAEVEVARLKAEAAQPGMMARVLADRLADALAAAVRRASAAEQEVTQLRAEASAAQLQASATRPGALTALLAWIRSGFEK